MMAKKLNIKIDVILTNGSQPIGNGIGPLLEARDVLYVLRRDNKGPLDLEKKSLLIAGKLLELGGKAKKFNGYKLAKEILDSGKAYKKFEEIVTEQGGLLVDPEKMKLAKNSYNIKADRAGKVIGIDNKFISRIAVMVSCPKDKKSGIFLYKHKNNVVKKGDVLYTIFSESKDELKFALKGMGEKTGFEIK